MQPQTQLKPHLSPNSSFYGQKRIKPLPHAGSGLNRLKNKKGAIPLFVIATTIILIIIGLTSLFLTSQKAEAGVSQEQAKKDIDMFAPGAETQPTGERDSNPETSTPDGTAENTPPTEITQECKVTGKWDMLWVKEKTPIDRAVSGVVPKDKAMGVFTYTGTCVADVYLEAGIVPQTRTSLAIQPNTAGFIPSRPSWCDANKNYYGHLWKDMKPGQQFKVLFRPQTPQEEGQYKMTIGAYTGCLSDKTTQTAISASGKEIISNSYTIRISNNLYAGIVSGSETDEARLSWEEKFKNE